MLTLRLLGATLARLGDTSVSLKRRKSRALLYYLAAQPQPVARRRLITLLWGDHNEQTARHNLRTTLYGLRQAIGDHLRAEDEAISLVDAQVDARDFAAVLTHPGSDLAALTAALACYQGDFLADFELGDSDDFGDWVAVEREHYRRLAIRGYQQVSRGHEAAGDYAAALDALTAALTLDPFQEDLQRDALRLHTYAGDRAGAIRRYEELTRLLDDEMGVPPMAETRALYDAIITDSLPPAPRPAAPQPAAPLIVSPTAPQRPPTPAPSRGRQDGGAPGGPPFAGRAAELRRLQESVGRGQLILVEGEAGMGKSRLVETFLAAAHAADAPPPLILVGRARELESRLPYQPIIEALRGLVAEATWPARRAGLHLSPVWWAEVARLLPEVADPTPTAAGLRAPDESRLWEGVFQLLAALAVAQPLLCFLDDLHWADADTLAVISRLAQRLADAPIFLLLACRSDDLAENEALATLLHALRRKSAANLLEVTRFDRFQVQQYVNALIGPDNAFNGELARLLFEATQGNPLFVTESLRDLLERYPTLLHNPKEADTSASFPPTLTNHPAAHPPAGLAAPQIGAPDIRTLLTSQRTPRVHDLILERMERLPDPALWVLQLSAVIARDYSLELLETAATEDPLAGLETLLQRKFLIERPDQRLDFSHQTVRQVAYESMSALQRRRWHLRVANALVKLHRAEHNPAETAFHYSQSGQAGRIPDARYSILAGEQLLRSYGFRQAIDFFNHTLSILDGLPDAPADLIERAMLGRGLAYESLFDLEGVTDSYRHLLGWARERGDRGLLLSTHGRMASVLGLMGQDRESNQLIQELIGVLEQTDDGEPVRLLVLKDLLERRAVIYSPEDDLPAGTGTRANTDGVRAAPAAGIGVAPAAGMGVAPAAEDWAAYTPPPPVVRDPVGDVLRSLEPVHAVLPLLDYGWTLLVQGQLGEATACLSAVVDLASETAQPSIASTALHQLAVTARILGEMEQSQALNDQSVAINRKVPGAASELASMWPRIASALLSLQAGRLDEAERRLRRVLDFLGSRETYRNYRNSANIGLGLVQLARGDSVTARSLLAGALVDPVNLYPYMHVRALLGLARIARMEGDDAGADALLRRTLHFAGSRSLLDEYIETVLEIAAQRPAGAPITRLIDEILAYIRPVGFESAIRRLEAAREACALPTYAASHLPAAD